MKLRTTAFLLVFGSVLAAAEIRPVALSCLADNRLIGLDGLNALLIIDPILKTTQKVDLTKRFEVIDLAAGGGMDENLIFITTRGKDPNQSPIIQFSSQGRELKYWIIPVSAPACLALDYPQRSLYISTLQDVSIYKVDLRDQTAGNPKWLTQVRGAIRLGALAIDPSRNRLFAADAFSGTVYVVSLSTLNSSLFARELGQPSALALSHNGETLYVADCSHRCIWSLRVNQPSPIPVKFWSSKDMREPRGLTVDSSGTIWIGDKSTKTIFGVSPTGQEIARFR